MDKIRDFIKTLNIESTHPVILSFAGIGVISAISLILGLIF